MKTLSLSILIIVAFGLHSVFGQTKSVVVHRGSAFMSIRYPTREYEKNLKKGRIPYVQQKLISTARDKAEMHGTTANKYLRNIIYFDEAGNSENAIDDLFILVNEAAKIEWTKGPFDKCYITQNKEYTCLRCTVWGEFNRTNLNPLPYTPFQYDDQLNYTSLIADRGVVLSKYYNYLSPYEVKQILRQTSVGSNNAYTYYSKGRMQKDMGLLIGWLGSACAGGLGYLVGEQTYIPYSYDEQQGKVQEGQYKFHPILGAILFCVPTITVGIILNAKGNKNIEKAINLYN